MSWKHRGYPGALLAVIGAGCSDSQSALAAESAAATAELAEVLSEVVDETSARAAVPRLEQAIAALRRVEAWIPYVQPPAGSQTSYQERLSMLPEAWKAIERFDAEVQRVYETAELRAIVEPVLVRGASEDPSPDPERPR